MSLLAVVIKWAWLVTMLASIGCLAIGDLSEEQRLWVFTTVSWLAAPASFIASALATWLIVTLDIHQARAIHIIEGVLMAVGGYFQWWLAVLIIVRAYSARAKQSGNGPRD